MSPLLFAQQTKEIANIHISLGSVFFYSICENLSRSVSVQGNHMEYKVTVKDRPFPKDFAVLVFNLLQFVPEF